MNDAPDVSDGNNSAEYCLQSRLLEIKLKICLQMGGGLKIVKSNYV